MIHHADDWLTIHGGDARDVLPTLEAESVDCIVTSPPYWGLRDYGEPGQFGLEATPEEYVANLVGVFRELRRVLKRSGTCWLNLGDSYAGSGRGGNPPDSEWSGFMGNKDRERAAMPHLQSRTVEAGAIGRNWVAPPPGLKPKDLVGIPWRVAFALQSDGWWLRSDIIWAKPNPMPESVTDRPTKAHEYLFLLTKAERYYFDQEAVREASISAGEIRGGGHKASTNGIHGNRDDGQRLAQLGVQRTATSRNLRSVWTIATRPYPGAHFAVFPPELPERCIKAGSSERGVVLDPFAGSGTVGLVANRLSRRAILIDLNPAYLEQQMKRNAQMPMGV